MQKDQAGAAQVAVSGGGMTSRADDDPITLAEACKLFPHAKLTVSTLRAEAARGRLDIFRIGKRDYTTPSAMRDMVNLCRAADHRRACISTKTEASGLSETVRTESAQAALNRTVQALKSGSLNTSAKSTSLKTVPTH
jgi:hypothetical protein